MAKCQLLASRPSKTASCLDAFGNSFSEHYLYSPLQKNRAVQHFAGAALIAAKGEGTSVRLAGTQFSDNSAMLSSAGALYTLVGANACITLDNINIIRNKASTFGGGGVFDVRSSGSVILRNVTAAQNTAGDAGGLQLQIHTDGHASIVACSFLDNQATQNGGAFLVNANCSASVFVVDTAMSRNRAGASGGALYVVYGHKDSALVDGSAFGPSLSPSYSPARSCPETTDLRQSLSLWSVKLLGNSAGKLGGAVFLAPASVLTLLSSTLTNNAACDGGGAVAACNCSSLLVRDTLIQNGTSTAFGGGLYAAGCRRIMLERLNVTGSRATVGGGLAILGPSEISTASHKSAPSATSASGAAASSSAFEYTSVLMHRVRVYGNSAGAGTPAGPDVGCVTSGDATPGGGQPVAFSGKGLGGGLFMTGKTVAVLSRSDLSQPNNALVGTAIASRQRCTGNESLPSAAASDANFKQDEMVSRGAYPTWPGVLCTVGCGG